MEDNEQEAPETERQFSRRVHGFFRRKLADSEWEKVLRVEQRVKVPTDFTFLRDRDGRWRLLVGFLEQDIVFYCPSHTILMEQFRSEAIRVDRMGGNPVIIPLLVCELKVGARHRPVIHTLITASSIASRVKSAFPHCACYFVMNSNRVRGFIRASITRHCKGFDRVFLNWEQECEQIWSDACAHFRFLSERGLLA